MQYAWCDWQLGLKLFIIQYGWLSDEARGRERERERASRRRVGGGTVHFVEHSQAGNVDFSLLSEHSLRRILDVTVWLSYCMHTIQTATVQPPRSGTLPS